MYVTTEEFEQQVGTNETIELTNLDSPDADSINLPRLELAIKEASSEINGYLATRYSIPLTSVPSYIKTYCIDIAWYRLAQNNAPEAYSERYKNAIARLKDIEKGVMLIVDENGIAASPRQEQNSLVDNRGFPLDDWTVHSGECKTNFENLNLY